MSQLPIEHLLQAAPLRSDRALSSTGRQGPSVPAFDDHFAQVTTTSNDPPKKTAPEPVANILSSPDNHLRSESASPRDANDSADGNRPENSAAEAPADNESAREVSPQKDQKSPSKLVADSEQNTSASSSTQSTNGEQEEFENADNTEDSEDEAEATEAATLVSVQAIAQTNDGQIAACGEEFVEQNASNDSDIAPLKSQTTGESPQSTKKSAAVVESYLPESKQAVADVTTENFKEARKPEVAKPDHSQPTRKHDGHHKKQASEAIDCREQDTADVKNESLLATDVTIATSENSSTKTDRPTRPNRTSTKKDQSGASEKKADEVSGPGRAPARAETVTLSDGPTANPVVLAAAVTPPNAVTSDNDSQKAGKPSTSRTDSLSHPLGKLQLGSGRTTGLGRGEEGQDKPQVDPARFVSRVSKAFQTAQQRGGTLQLRLSPPELGALRLELSVKDGAMTAVLQTETDTARRVLLDHLPALRDRLAEQNIRIERFDVDVRREDNGGHADGRMLHNQEQRQQDQQANNRTPRRAVARPTVSVGPAKASPRPTAFGDSNGLNIVA